MEEGKSAFKMLTGKPTGKRPLGRPWHRWEDNIRIDLKEICINTRNWINSAQDRDYWRAHVNAALNFRLPYSMELVRLDKKITRNSPVIGTRSLSSTELEG